jgi:hypothetical protein
LENGNQIGTGVLDANGNTSFNTTSLEKGKHTVTSVYDGDTNFLSSTSDEVTFYVVDPSVVITTTTPTLTLTAGTPGTATIIVNPVVTYNEEGVQLACVNVPQYSECTFDTPTVGFSDNKPKTVNVTISTNVPVNVGAIPKNARPGSGFWFAAGTFALGIVGIGFGRKARCNRRVLMMICSVLILSGAVAGMSACGGSGYTKTPPAPHVTTPSGTTTVSIVAKKGARTVSVPFALTVTVK